MSFQDEWASCKASAATRMTLAHALPPDHATATDAAYPGDPALKISMNALRSVARTANAVYASAKAARTKLDTCHEGVASGASGFHCIETLSSVRTSWETRLEDIRDKCETVSEAFSGAAGLHSGNENDVKQSFKSRIKELHETQSADSQKGR